MLAKIATISFWFSLSVNSLLTSSKFRMIPASGAKIMPLLSFSEDCPGLLSDLQKIGRLDQMRGYIKHFNYAAICYSYIHEPTTSKYNE